MNSTKKVAIIQNRIQAGGRLHVIISIIKILNNLGIEPEIITLKSRISKQDIINKYGENIKFILKEILHDVRIPFEFHILLFNFICRFYLKKYALVINSNNTSFLLPQKINLISYTHYPRKDRLLSKYVSIHFPDGPKKSWFNPFHIFENIVALIYRLNHRLNKNECVIANSKFSSDAVQLNYPKDKKSIHIIYPPVSVGSFSKIDLKEKSTHSVVSIGRFAPDKRQLEQIKIASQLKNFTFHIIGFAKQNDKYFKKCNKYVSENNLSNVKLHANISYEKMQSLLKQSMFFIHNLRNEPFGITAVQAISQGCIPIVHNSGGQKEIVIYDDLRYNDVNQAIQIFSEYSKKSIDELNQIQKSLYEKVKQYDENIFYKEMKEVITKHL